ncbi:MAG: hypothetical protein ACI8QZ_002670 [Chlamydiales bacterium]|jgi:hypothetical protein
MTRPPETNPTAQQPGASPEFTIVVPVTERDAEVLEVVAALGGQLDRLDRTWECLLVYDGVEGPVWERGLELQATSGDQVRTVALNKPFGETVCLSSAFDHARGKVIMTSPQYVQTDPSDLIPLIEALDAGADLVASWRQARVDPWLNRIQSNGFNWIMRRLVGADFHDLNSTLRVFRREVLEDLTIYGDMYRYLPVLAYRQGFRVVEVPVRHLKERGRAGLFGPGVYLRRMLDILGVMFLTKFTHKPLRFFGMLGGTLLLAGAALAGWMALEWLVDDNLGLYQRPLFMVGVILGVLGLQVIGFGLVGEIVIFTQARNVREYRVERIYE